MKNLLLIYAGPGSYQGKRAGVIMTDCALPIAAWPDSQTDDEGVMACWEAIRNVDDFSMKLELEHTPAPGLWVVEMDHDGTTTVGDDGDDDGNQWPHLVAGAAFGYPSSFRRPTKEEMQRISEGLPPWDGGAWL